MHQPETQGRGGGDGDDPKADPNRQVGSPLCPPPPHGHMGP